MMIYTGERLAAGCVQVWCRDRAPNGFEVAEPLPLYLQECNHSPCGFEWGYGGSGPAQLAYALLRHSGADARNSLLLHQVFKAEIITRLVDRWELTQEEIKNWLGRHAIL